MATESNKNKAQNELTNDTGFGSRALPPHHRLLKDDGTFNIVLRGLPWFRPSETFQHLIKMSWLKFSIIVLLFYVAINTFFALIYFFIGTENLTNTDSQTTWGKFLDAFFFSSQSLTTVGYGRVAPLGVATSSVAAFESMIGLLGFAIATGLLYGRFSKPTAKIIHSKNILIGPHAKGIALMFRIANKRESQLVDAELQVTYKRDAIESGRDIRHFIPLKLESHRLNMFPLSWTLIHVINEESPLKGKSLEELLYEDMEILIYFKGYDETFSNNVHCRVSYKATDLIWGARFVKNFEEFPGKPTVHYLNRISDYEKIELPPSEGLS